MTTAPISSPVTDSSSEHDADRYGGIGDVHHLGTAVQDAQGPVHTGGGDQTSVTGAAVYYNSTFYSSPQEESRRRRAMAITEYRIDWLRERFVPPEHFEEVANRLSGPDRTVLIGGPSGSGRRTAAQMILCPAAEVARTVQLLPVEVDDRTGQVDVSAIQESDIAAEDRLLLDLSEIGEVALPEWRRALHGLLPIVSKNAALLAVVLPAEYERAVLDEFSALLVEIEPPDPQEVLAAYLTADGLVQSKSLPPGIPDDLPRSMGDVARLADRVRRLGDRGAAGELNDWIKEALDAPARQRSIISGLLPDVDATPGRALLLSMAMLAGGPVDAVFDARQMLLDAVGFADPAEPTALQLRSVAQELEPFPVQVLAGDRRRLHFLDPDLGAAVLEHFWDEFPRLRLAIAQWVRSILDAPGLSFADQQRVGSRFLDLCLRSRQVELALDVAEAWGKHRYRSVRAAAYAVLARLLSDEPVASRVTKQIYWWSRTRKLHPQLAGIVIALCVNVLAPGRLDQAVVRLRGLLHHRDDEVVKAALEGLKTIAVDEQAFGQVLKLLLEKEGFNADVFGEVASPCRMASMPPGPAGEQTVHFLMEGWRRVLDTRSLDEWSQAVEPWLRVHAESVASGSEEVAGSVRAALLNICGTDTSRLAALFTANLRWIRAADDLVERGHRAQAGIQLDEAIHQARTLRRRQTKESV